MRGAIECVLYNNFIIVLLVCQLGLIRSFAFLPLGMGEYGTLAKAL